MGEVRQLNWMAVLCSRAVDEIIQNMITFIFLNVSSEWKHACIWVFTYIDTNRRIIHTHVHLSPSSLYPWRVQRGQFEKHFLAHCLSLSLTKLVIFLYLCFSSSLSHSPSSTCSSVSPSVTRKPARSSGLHCLFKTPPKPGCVISSCFCRETACLNLQPDSVSSSTGQGDGWRQLWPTCFH